MYLNFICGAFAYSQTLTRLPTPACRQNFTLPVSSRTICKPPMSSDWKRLCDLQRISGEAIHCPNMENPGIPAQIPAPADSADNERMHSKLFTSHVKDEGLECGEIREHSMSADSPRETVESTERSHEVQGRSVGRYTGINKQQDWGTRDRKEDKAFSIGKEAATALFEGRRSSNLNNELHQISLAGNPFPSQANALSGNPSPSDPVVFDKAYHYVRDRLLGDKLGMKNISWTQPFIVLQNFHLFWDGSSDKVSRAVLDAFNKAFRDKIIYGPTPEPGWRPSRVPIELTQINWNIDWPLTRQLRKTRSKGKVERKLAKPANNLFLAIDGARPLPMSPSQLRRKRPFQPALQGSRSQTYRHSTIHRTASDPKAAEQWSLYRTDSTPLQAKQSRSSSQRDSSKSSSAFGKEEKDCGLRSSMKDRPESLQRARGRLNGKKEELQQALDNMVQLSMKTGSEAEWAQGREVIADRSAAS